MFAIPYESDYTLIGTTDQEYRGDPADIRIDDDEIDYLLDLGEPVFRDAGDP